MTEHMYAAIYVTAVICLAIAIGYIGAVWLDG